MIIMKPFFRYNRDKLLFRLNGGALLPDGSVFIHIPKTGGTNFVKGKRNHFTIEEYARLCPEFVFNQQILAIYRPNNDRIISCINYMIDGGNKKNYGPFSDLNPSRELTELFRLLKNHTRTDRDYILIKNLVSELKSTNRMFWESSKFVMINGKVAVTKIIKIKDIDLLSNKITNKSSYKIRKSPELENILSELYLEDDILMSKFLNKERVIK